VRKRERNKERKGERKRERERAREQERKCVRVKVCKMRMVILFFRIELRRESL